jgi:WD40 repeat protein
MVISRRYVNVALMPLLLWVAVLLSGSVANAAEVSFYKQVRPILQTHCQGCHQPAKPGGEYIMTSHDRLLKAGESGSAAVVPGKPQESNLFKQITPGADGKAEMPKGKPALTEAERETIANWITAGAKDDTPASTQTKYDREHPPIYARSPVITSLDFSPDGTLLAVAGFHEALLLKAENGEQVARLIGLSERIETVKFSPDGSQLAVVGGNPGRMGEVQIWDVAKREVLLSAAFTFDTLYGASWSPDGKLLAFGCADNTCRAMEVATGKQVLQLGTHSDWVLGTAFSPDSTHLVSVGRDMTAKLTETATERFIDNVTSITPGALKGGIQAVAMHPTRNEIVVGGSDGIPKAYRIFRTSARQIGDDANLIKPLPAMPGRVFAVAVSADGTLVAAGSALDNVGQVMITPFPLQSADKAARIKQIEGKKEKQRTKAEIAELEKLRTPEAAGVTVPLPQSSVYTLAFHPEGKHVAVAGSDGLVRLIDTTGKILTEFSPVPIQAAVPPSSTNPLAVQPMPEKLEPESLPSGSEIAELLIEPREIRLRGKYDYAQTLITAKLKNGALLDVTRLATKQIEGTAASVSASGTVHARGDGSAKLQVSLQGQTASCEVQVSDAGQALHPDYIRDINPILARLGCNQGTCHGAVKGKNGFKLSLRGYDPLYDLRALTDDLASRRVNTAAPESSLMLLKATGAVPHQGGALIQPGDAYYETLRAWITDGAKLKLDSGKVTSIEVSPKDPIVQAANAQQQVRVVANYADGSRRDVTREAFVESGNTEVAVAAKGGLLQALRRGEAPILVRYEGSYAATTLTVMGDRSGFTWEAPPTFNKLDEFTAAKWERMKIRPSDLCTDAEFLRRVSLDLTGLPPKADEVKQFLADSRPSQEKRAALIDQLIGSEAFIDHWTNKWADLLQVNRKFLGAEGAAALRTWIRQEVAENRPYDQFARRVLTASGSNKENPAASYYKILRDPLNTMENTTHLFLSIRFNCNKCHDHPFERWTQDQYYQTAAFFAQFELKKDPQAGDRNIGGTAVEGAKPLFEIVADKPAGEVNHERTGKPEPPKFPFDCQFQADEKASRRERLAAWTTSPDNPYFARAYVNRLWGYMFGVGIMEPIDDIRAGNPPSNPELLDYLTKEFVAQKFDIRHMLRLICNSRTYQLSFVPNRWNEDDRINYSHALPRRLSAEALFDSVHRVVGATTNIPGVPAGVRAAQLPDSGVDLPSGFFSTFGRPNRESTCECERSSGLQLGPVMALVSGPTIGDAINQPQSELAKLVAAESDDRKLIDEIFLRVLNRPASPPEIEAALAEIKLIPEDHAKLTAAYQQREADVATLKPVLEKKREDSIAAAKNNIAAFEQEIAPRVAEQEAKRQANIQEKEAAAKKYETDLPLKQAEWEKKQALDDAWLPLQPEKVSGLKDAKFTPQPDGSVLVEVGKENAKGIITLDFKLDQRNITAIRLEAISDAALPKQGPGLADDGNFVLTELEVLAAPQTDAKNLAKVDLQNALADFSQDKYEVAKAIDGNPNDGNGGWAVAPLLGYTHWATFETKTPINHEGGSVLQVKLHHKFNRTQFVLGKFRLSVIVDRPKIGLSLAEAWREIIKTPAEQRSEEQKNKLAAYYRATDKGFKPFQDALNEARKPLPIDPKLVALREQLELVSQPLPEDRQLVQLKQDVEYSKQQVANVRLTAAQDLVWALINSPAFLFNR